MNPSASLPTYIDSTMMSTFRQCPQKFYTEFCLNLRPASLSIDLHAGGCFASALENVYRHYWSGASFEEAKLRAFGQYMDQWGDFVSNKPNSPKTRERVWEAVEEYFRRWSPETDPVQPLNKTGGGAYEFTFALPLGPTWEPGGGYKEHPNRERSQYFPRHPSGEPFIYAGRFDLLGVWNDRPIIRDEKTTTSIGSSWANQWGLRSQFMGYVWACQQSGIDLDTVCVRGVGILKTKIDLAEAFKQYSKAKIARWHEQLRRDLWRLRACWDAGYFDYNFADACTAYGGCPFTDLCESDHPERWHDQFAKRSWSPLQKNPIAEDAA